MSFYFNCPNCGSNDDFMIPNEQETGLGCALLVFGGLIPALIYDAAQRNRIQCANCGFIFRQPAMPRSPVSTLAVWIVAIVILFCLTLVTAIGVPEIGSLLPDWPIIRGLEQIIAQHPRAIIVGFLLVAPLLIVVCLIASWVGNFKFRKEFRKMYRTTVVYSTRKRLGTLLSHPDAQPSFPVQSKSQPSQANDREDRPSRPGGTASTE